MHGRGAEPVQGQEMLAHRIALVPGKAIARILPVQPLHARVARGLGEDGRRGADPGARSALVTQTEETGEPAGGSPIHGVPQLGWQSELPTGAAARAARPLAYADQSIPAPGAPQTTST